MPLSVGTRLHLYTVQYKSEHTHKSGLTIKFTVHGRIA